MKADDDERRLYKLLADASVTGSFKRTLNSILILRAAREPRSPPDGDVPRKRWVLVVPTLFLGGAGFLAANPEALGQLLGH